MTTNAKTADKSTVLDSLAYDTKTAKRVAYSQWEFTIVAPYEIEVCNASYGYLKDEHVYRVMIDEAGIPVSCNCKGFKHYHSPNGRVGKHMLAVATVGGQTLLDAAMTFPPHSVPSREIETITEKLQPNGGTPETCPNDDLLCHGPRERRLAVSQLFRGGESLIMRTDGGFTFGTRVRDHFNERPDDCDCTPLMQGLPCWPCYRDNFKKPAEVSDQ